MHARGFFFCVLASFPPPNNGRVQSLATTDSARTTRHDPFTIIPPTCTDHPTPKPNQTLDRTRFAAGRFLLAFAPSSLVSLEPDYSDRPAPAAGGGRFHRTG